jgi:hypothetical protein|tara:strand:+ start:626 stop:757 length:132 start_codon:yes stop_codon:yes gene_type:complete
MNNFDKIERKKRAATDDDVYWEYAKLVFLTLIVIIYLYTLFKQ